MKHLIQNLRNLLFSQKIRLLDGRVNNKDAAASQVDWSQYDIPTFLRKGAQAPQVIHKVAK